MTQYQLAKESGVPRDQGWSGEIIAEGKIRGVDEPASTYLSEWAGDGRAKITVRHLLQMSSGLAAGED